MNSGQGGWRNANRTRHTKTKPEGAAIVLSSGLIYIIIKSLLNLPRLAAMQELAQRAGRHLGLYFVELFMHGLVVGRGVYITNDAERHGQVSTHHGQHQV